MSKRVFKTGLNLGTFFFSNLQKDPIELRDLTIPPEGLREQAGNFYVSATATGNNRYYVSISKESGSSNSTRPQAEKIFDDYKKALTSYYWAIRTLRRLQGLGEENGNTS